MEAAIQSVHIQQAVTGRQNGRAIVTLYEVFVRFAPTVGAYTAYAIATGEAYGPEAGLAILDTLPFGVTPSYQTFWVGKGYLLASLKRHDESRSAYRMAIGLSEEPTLRAYLSRQLQSIAA